MKNIIFDIGGVLFNYNRLDLQNALLNKAATPFEKIESGHDILYSCFNKIDEHHQKQFSLFILSNCSRNFFESLSTQHPETFALFDGIVISGDVDFKKPDIRIYLHLINKYNLDPSECLFIDDQFENIKMAEEIGMKGILFNFNYCSSKFEKLLKI